MNVDFLAAEFRRTWPTGPKVYTPPYGQIAQSTLAPCSELYRIRPTIVFVFFDAQDILGESLIRPFGPGKGRSDRVDDALRTIDFNVKAIHENLPNAQLILNTVPTPPGSGLGLIDSVSDVGLSALFSNFNSGIARIVDEIPGAVVFDYQQLAYSHGLTDWFDSRMWYLARSRISAAGLKITAESLARLIGLMRQPRAKCVVMDLDNTCWGGIAGDDGPANVKVGSDGIGLAFSEFQRALLNLRDQGILLAVASKNDLATVDAVFENHPGMVLSKNDISAWRVGWGDKATAMTQIAEELGIGLDSLVFVDDNPAERDLVRNLAPEVTVLEMPRDPSAYVQALITEPSLQTLDLTAEDLDRAELYNQRKERIEHESSFEDIEGYLSSLEMEATIGELDSYSLDRVTQLILKTNQFNLTGRKWLSTELISGTTDGSLRAFWLRLRDKFGDEGLIGVAIIEVDDEAWNIGNFIMSCRVIGRGLEAAFIGNIAREAALCGITKVTGSHVRTDRNQLTDDLLQRLGFDEADTVWTSSVTRLIQRSPSHISVDMLRSESTKGQS